MKLVAGGRLISRKLNFFFNSNLHKSLDDKNKSSHLPIKKLPAKSQGFFHFSIELFSSSIVLKIKQTIQSSPPHQFTEVA